MKNMKVLDQINKDLDELANDYARGNASGIPVTHGCSLTLERLDDLRFKERINVTHPRLPTVLRELAAILEKYF